MGRGAGGRVVSSFLPKEVDPASVLIQLAHSRACVLVQSFALALVLEILGLPVLWGF